MAVIGQSSPLPFFAGGMLSFLVFGLARVVQDDLKWRLRHWTGKEVVVALRAEAKTPAQFAVADMIAPLVDPATPVVQADAADVYAQMPVALRALIAGQPHQALNQISGMGAALGSGTVTRAEWDDELVFIFAATADILTGALDEAGLRRLQGLLAAGHPLLRLCAAWALAHHHLGVGESERAQALFASLFKAAPGLPVLHHPIGHLPALEPAATQP